jgi:preprotein translocase subunit YajC
VDLDQGERARRAALAVHMACTAFTSELLPVPRAPQSSALLAGRPLAKRRVLSSSDVLLAVDAHQQVDVHAVDWAQGAGGGGGDFLVQLFPLILIFVVFYFLLIRPQQAKVRAQREMLAGVKRGDRVVTGGGIIGLVTKVISDNEVQVELAEGVRVRIIKQTITDILTRGESVRGPKDSNEDDDKPMLPPPAAAPERKSLLGGLFGGGKK